MRFTLAMAASCAATDAWAISRKRTPSGVSDTALDVRAKSALPTNSSSFAIRRLTADCVAPKSSPAAVKLLSSATTVNVRRRLISRSSMIYLNLKFQTHATLVSQIGGQALCFESIGNQYWRTQMSIVGAKIEQKTSTTA